MTVTITEVGTINVLGKIEENLSAIGLRPRDVISMRANLTGPPGAETEVVATWPS